MEIHQPHHTTHKKKWSEYVLESFMLFFAVTLGFFTENYREHSIIENRMQENYRSLIVDLKQDLSKIDSIFIEGEKGTNLIALSHFLYQHKKQIIAEDQLVDSLYNLGTIPNYTTLFINNATFKNMQSSGLLSYVTNKDLKTNLSYYYEVIFKRMDDNNKLFDDVGYNYFNNYLVFQISTNSRNNLSTKSVYNKYENDFKDVKSYRRFVMDLKSTREILISEDFIISTNTYIARYYSYQKLLNTVKENNKALLQLLEKEIEKFD